MNDLGLCPEGLEDLLVHRPPDVPVLHLAGVLLLLLHLDDVMNLGVVTCHTHWCCQTPNISTADHIPALIEEHSS